MLSGAHLVSVGGKVSQYRVVRRVPVEQRFSIPLSSVCGTPFYPQLVPKEEITGDDLARAGTSSVSSSLGVRPRRFASTPTTGCPGCELGSGRHHTTVCNKRLADMLAASVTEPVVSSSSRLSSSSGSGKHKGQSDLRVPCLLRLL